MFRVCLCVLLLGVPVSAQVLQFSGGRSTLLGGTGGEITAFFPESTLSASAGFADGHFVLGPPTLSKFHGLDITAGDKNFAYSFDGAGLGVSTRGLFVQRNTRHTSLAIFVGSTGIGYATPFMVTARAQHIGAGVFLQRHFDNGLLLSSLAVIDGGNHTAVQGLSYRNHLLHLAGSGGLLQNQKYFSGEADFQPLRSLSAFAGLGHITLQASLLDGRYRLLKTTGASAGASLRIASITLRSNFYESNHRDLLVHMVQEHFHHWTISGIVNQLQGQTSYAFGGGYQGNKVGVSLDHAVLFFPVGSKGFQQTTTVQVSLRIHDTALNFQTYVDPMMHVQYTTYASSYVQGPLAGLAMNNQSHSTGGKFVIAGAVVDEHGQPVEGAAIQLQGGAVVYSDSQGKFFARVKHDKPVGLVVLLQEFAAPGLWAVMSCPANVAPGTDVLIKLRREAAP